ncbi:MAG: helix-hairpin-helix domain-containing protein [Geobacter sp.]|nr:MAG: helix-hairpin-helix domain-containing protein [Geobacter sp.]
MNEWPGRLVLWLLMLAVFLLLFLHGRPGSHSREKLAFLPGGRATGGSITIRIEGDGVKPGIYQFYNNVSLGTVTNMTVPFLREKLRNPGMLKNILYTGDVVSVLPGDGQYVEIKRDSVQVMEKMILGIPLNPNSLTAAEWEMLPRIGPALAKRIVLDRQYNGEFLSINDLDRVPGIGAATVKQLEAYFSHALAY